MDPEEDAENSPLTVRDCYAMSHLLKDENETGGTEDVDLTARYILTY